MATASSPKGSSNGDSNLKCPICLESFDRPIEIPCGHSFCNDCIMNSLSKVSASQCPVCRTSFTTVQMTDNRRLMSILDTTNELCLNCNKLVALSSLKNHKKICASVSGARPKHMFKSLAAESQPASRVPNRSTFKCPYCDLPNLDRAALLEHVKKLHATDTTQVVCPICSSMPWGNPDQQSADFKQHLNLRHKFNYDTYVDFHNDEDKMLQSVIEKSMTEM